MARIELIQGDIVDQRVDAIVNAANSSLLGGGGVDGAIHRAAGPTLLEECRAVRDRTGGCPAGEVRVTGAGRLSARYVIHGVGPVFREDRAQSCDALLAAVHEAALAAAVDRSCASVAFPAISTGAYRFPIDRAARVAVGAVRGFLARTGASLTVRFVLFGAEQHRAFRDQLGADAIDV